MLLPTFWLNDGAKSAIREVLRAAHGDFHLLMSELRGDGLTTRIFVYCDDCRRCVYATQNELSHSQIWERLNRVHDYSYEMSTKLVETFALYDDYGDLIGILAVRQPDFPGYAEVDCPHWTEER